MIPTTLTTAPRPTAATGDVRAHVLAGARAMAPWLLGVAPFGLVIGISAAQSDVPTLAGWLTGPLVFAGSAQVATIQLLDGGASPAVVILAALAINLRLVLYSAAMAPHWRDVPRRWQALFGYLLIDPTLAVGIDGYDRNPDKRSGHLRYLGAGAALWVAWLAAIAVGASAGASLPSGWHLEMVIPLFLLGEVVPRLDSSTARRSVATAVGLALVSQGVPLHLGALLAILGGLGVALVSDRPDARRRP
jgi:predicted branched-subunit amino acid permease